MIVAACDGSALSNPGPAGWAWYISDDIWAAGGWDHGTNNMGELMAVLDLLQSTAHTGEPLRILADSQYVINSLTKWLPGWKRRGWKKGDGKPVLNVELMKQLDEALQGRDVTFEWVKGHAGHVMNEAADERARAAATAFMQGREPDVGPGFPAADAKARSQVFAPNSVEETPALFQLEEPDAEPGPTTPGSASPRVKAALLAATRQLLSDDVRTDAARLAELLHPDFVAHGVDGEVIAADHGAWRETSPEFEVLAMDAYSESLVGVRWLQGDKQRRLRFNLWQKTPAGWKLRFAQVTAQQ
ncbi:ribonuclease HI family protein [Tessaracoccus rhinocerotis]|uniref:Ribonuclease H n=1 Tax=Tessaracoccus rhinocerotis TaxID=1689449 RepID=A0A553K526_9ACTN|nr:ribonuclease HI family protein [Tessaracoccus rhinocerotis]TRY19806.1 ribonuclease HI family protein [Tessaracoccus rhinocerotis]